MGTPHYCAALLSCQRSTLLTKILRPFFTTYLPFSPTPHLTHTPTQHTTGSTSLPNTDNMSKRAGVPNGVDKAAKEATKQPSQDKQAHLLQAQNPGHFSLVRAYHLADF